MARLKVRELASGHIVGPYVYHFKGSNPKAPKVYMQSSIHGAEIQGNAVIALLIEHFRESPPLGDVTLVPLANPAATDRKNEEFTNGRFDPTTGDNWNRNYWYPLCKDEDTRKEPEQINLDDFLDEYRNHSDRDKIFRKTVVAAIKKRLKSNISAAKRLALSLQSMAFEADFVLDLHNANRSVPHVYSPDYALEDAKAFCIRYVISIPGEFSGALDEAMFAPWQEWYAALGEIEAVPVQAFTLEHGDQESLGLERAKSEFNGIMNYLRKKGVVKGRYKEPNEIYACDLKDYHTFYAPRGGLYDFSDVLGTKVKKGTKLAESLHFDERGPIREEFLATKPMIPILRYSSGIVHQGDELLKAFMNWRKI